MHFLAFLILAALAAPVVWLIAHLDRSGPRYTLREVTHALATFGTKLAEAGDLSVVTATAVDELKAKRDTALKTARDIAAKAEGESRDFNDAERAQVKALVEESKTLNRELAKATEDADLIAFIKATDEGLAVNTPGPLSKSKGTLGERFVKDGAVADYLKSLTGSGSGYVGEKTRVQSEAVHYAGFKDILSGGDHAGSAGPLVGPDFRGLLDVGTWQRPLHIRDVVSQGTTTSDTVTYARMLDVVNNAAPTAEASGTSAGDGSGDITGAKPESSMELETVNDTVKTLAHWIPVTKRALSDAAQIRTLIDTFLRYGLEEELEDQMVQGDGTGENFEGILNVSGTQAQAFDTDIFVTLRKAKTKAQVVGRARNLTLLQNPEDAETQDLIRDSQGRYIGAGPYAASSFGSLFGPTSDTVWGMQRVVTEAVPAGTGIVGDFRWAMLWDREQAAVMLSDSHADFFTRNLVAALAELRAGFGVIRPAAFVITDLAA